MAKNKNKAKVEAKDQLNKLKEYDAIKQQLEELQSARKIDQTRYTELEKAHDDLAVQNQAYHNKIDELTIENSNRAKKQAMLEGEIEHYQELIADDKSKIADLKSKGKNSMGIILMEALVIIFLAALLALQLHH